MTKIHINLSIEKDLITEAKKLNINISDVLTKLLENIIVKYKNTGKINIELEKIKQQKALNKLTYWQSELKAAEDKIKRWQDTQEKKEIERLEKEAELRKSKNKCFNCKKISKGVKMHIIKNKIICNECYKSAPIGTLKKWLDLI